MLRRTKIERADDLGLPPRVVEIRRDFFNEEEKDLYQSLYSDSKRKFNDYVAEGVVLNNYANIFTLITRMRQLADHPDLVLKRVGSNAISMKLTGLSCVNCVTTKLRNQLNQMSPQILPHVYSRVHGIIYGCQ